MADEKTPPPPPPPPDPGDHTFSESVDDALHIINTHQPPPPQDAPPEESD